jgi:hypothetical protein
MFLSIVNKTGDADVVHSRFDHYACPHLPRSGCSGYFITIRIKLAVCNDRCSSPFERNFVCPEAGSLSNVASPLLQQISCGALHEERPARARAHTHTHTHARGRQNKRPHPTVHFPTSARPSRCRGQGRSTGRRLCGCMCESHLGQRNAAAEPFARQEPSAISVSSPRVTAHRSMDAKRMGAA